MPRIGLKRYLGDAVYVQYDGYSLILTTEDGISVTNTIVLEPEVFAALITFANSPQSQQKDVHR